MFMQRVADVSFCEGSNNLAWCVSMHVLVRWAKWRVCVYVCRWIIRMKLDPEVKGEIFWTGLYIHSNRCGPVISICQRNTSILKLLSLPNPCIEVVIQFLLYLCIVGLLPSDRVLDCFFLLFTCSLHWAHVGKRFSSICVGLINVQPWLYIYTALFSINQ